MEHLKTASFDHEPPREDDIIVCRFCAGLSKVTSDGTVVLTSDEFNFLDQDYKDSLNFAIRVITQK